MKQNETKKGEKGGFKFVCEDCDLRTNDKYKFNRHIKTKKHIETNLKQKGGKRGIIAKQILCTCGMEFTSRTSLWRHNKICMAKTQEQILGEQNYLLMAKNQELTDKIVNICENIQPTTITIQKQTNNTNNFNLNFYLNETCKNAMNIGDFVAQLLVGIQDLEEMGKLGYAAGISKIIINGLKELNTNDIPVHCSDLKREILYVKDNDTWNKTEKQLLSNAIKIVAHKNIKNISEWKAQYPDCGEYNSTKNTQYLQIISNSMAGRDSEESDKNMNKIIHNIAKETFIEKN